MATFGVQGSHQLPPLPATCVCFTCFTSTPGLCTCRKERGPGDLAHTSMTGQKPAP